MVGFESTAKLCELTCAIGLSIQARSLLCAETAQGIACEAVLIRFEFCSGSALSVNRASYRINRDVGGQVAAVFP